MSNIFRKITRAIGAISTAYKLVSFALTGGIAIVSAAWTYLIGAHWLVASAAAIGFAAVALALLGSLGWYLFIPPKGQFTSRWLKYWYDLPFRRIRWSFGQFLGASRIGDEAPKVSQFQISFRIGRGSDLRPKSAYLESRETGKRITVRIKTQKGYREAGQIELIPRGRRCYAQALFVPLEDRPNRGERISKEELFKEFYGFNFVFEYDGARFERFFSADEISMALEPLNISTPPVRQIRLSS